MLPIHTLNGNEKLLDFLRSNQKEVEQIFLEKGAVLLRGCKIYSLSEFQEASNIICDELFEYKFGSTPRAKLGGKVYSSTEYPNDRSIPLHNENSYTNQWSRKILFYCAIEPEVGGERPVDNSNEVLNFIDDKIYREFIESGVMYTRNYKPGMDLSWQQAFQTASKDEVEQLCNELSIKYKWSSDEILHTEQVCQATLEHPLLQREVWFNQAHLFHQSANPPDLQDYFKIMDPRSLPRNPFYGDGEPFNLSDLEIVRSACKRAEKYFRWQRGDLMLLDNIMYCHGRRPF
jgi:hypothetical protein